MKILFCGGSGVGKTAICSRLAGRPFPVSHTPTLGYNLLKFRVTEEDVILDIEIFDSAGDILSNEQAVSDLCFVDAAIVVVDSTNLDSLKDADKWNEKIDHYAPSISKLLFVNKADCDNKVVYPDSLDDFVSAAGFMDWAFTVGHPDLGDADTTRGTYEKQSTPEEMLRKLFRQKKVINPQFLCGQLWQVVKFVSWSAIDFADLTSTTLEAYLLNQLQLKDHGGSGSSKTAKIDDGIKYFAGVMTREKSEELLSTSPKGAFLLRLSEVNGEMRLVVKKQGVVHYWIDFSSGQFLLRAQSHRKVQFASLQELFIALELDSALGIEFDE